VLKKTGSPGESLQAKRGLSWPIRAGFIFHKVTNPFVRFILGSPLHSMLDGRLILITYTGRKSGKKHSLPVQYAESHDELIVVAGYHQHKKWWRNLLQESTINVCHRGRWSEAHAKAFDGDVEVIAPLLPDYLKRFRASARIRGFTLDSNGNIENPEKLGEEAKKTVMVKIRMLTL
jgi:deazaflavin-dependent oxidoreductase (nitroreductase family)